MAVRRLTRAARVTRVILTGLMIIATLIISLVAVWLSFLAIRELAIIVGWPSYTAWAVMPIIELFILVGAAEVALRMWDGRDDLARPRALAYGALVVTLALNVIDHLIKAAIDWYDETAPLRGLMIAGFAAIVPLAQILALHVLIERLRAIGERTATGSITRTRTGPTHNAITGTATGARSSKRTARRTDAQTGGEYVPASDEDRAMYETWLAGIETGTEPSGSQLARAAGKDPATGVGRKAARRYRKAHGMTGPAGPAARTATGTAPARTSGTDLHLVGTATGTTNTQTGTASDQASNHSTGPEAADPTSAEVSA